MPDILEVDGYKLILMVVDWIIWTKGLRPKRTKRMEQVVRLMSIRFGQLVPILTGSFPSAKLL